VIGCRRPSPPTVAVNRQEIGRVSVGNGSEAALQAAARPTTDVKASANPQPKKISPILVGRSCRAGNGVNANSVKKPKLYKQRGDLRRRADRGGRSARNGSASVVARSARGVDGSRNVVTISGDGHQ